MSRTTKGQTFVLGMGLGQILAALLLALFLAACTGTTWDGMNLMRPPFQCVTNKFALPMTVYAEGRFTARNLGGVPPGTTIIRRVEIRRGTVPPGEKMCFRWPWASRDGRVVGIAGPDSVASDWFDPWIEK